MLFDAKVNQTNYQVNVEESRNNWKISVKLDNKDEWKNIVVPKENFQVAEDGLVSLLYENSSYLIDLDSSGTDYTVYTRGSHRTVSILDDERILRDQLMGGGGLGGLQTLKAGMPGKIVKVFVKEGDTIKKGDPLLIMEAMKMENEMKATADAVISKVHVKEGQNVESGSTLVAFGKPD